MQLYDFQQEDIAKLVRQPSGLIGSEMGTGKTHEAIALDQEWWKESRLPTLIVAPLNTHDSWVEKYNMQAPDVDVVKLDRKKRAKFLDDIRYKRGDVFLMHWQGLPLSELQALQQMRFGTIIADEVHRASNRKAQQTHALKLLKAQHKLAMSGTASGDKPEGLWSILNWLYPTFYRSYWQFRKHYCIEEAVERGSGQYRQITGVKNINSLMEQIAPFYVRHLKKEQCCEHHPEGVMHWLPDKTYDTIWVDLSPTQRQFYEQMRKEMVVWIGEHEDTPLVANIVVAQMARLSQMALATPHHEGYKEVWNKKKGVYERKDVIKLYEPSSKIDALKELISDHPTKQLVVFSSSRQACYLAAEALGRAGITSEVLSGSTPQATRDGLVSRFGNGDFQVFIGVIAAVAEGIDGLQRATDTGIFLDRSWSTILNKQAEDRLHRGGQDNSVQIIDIMARNTLDWGRFQRLSTKWLDIKKILGDDYRTQKELVA